MVLFFDEKGELDLFLENLDLFKDCGLVLIVDEFLEVRGEYVYFFFEVSVSSKLEEGWIE